MNITPNFKCYGCKALAFEVFSLTLENKRTQYWYGIRLMFFRIWIGRYRWDPII